MNWKKGHCLCTAHIHGNRDGQQFLVCFHSYMPHMKKKRQFLSVTHTHTHLLKRITWTVVINQCSLFKSVVWQYATNKTKPKKQKTNKQNDYNTQTWHWKNAWVSQYIDCSMCECVQTRKHHWSSFQTAVTSTNTNIISIINNTIIIISFILQTGGKPLHHGYLRSGNGPRNTRRASARPFVTRR